MAYWNNEEDITNDMYELSEFCNIPQPAPEPSEFMKSLRGKPSIFDDDLLDDDLPDEQENECIPVRGHPLLRDTLRRPGGRPFLSSNHQTDIRQASGFGYGNDLIEHAIRGNSEEEKAPEKAKNFDFHHPICKELDKKSGEESDSTTSTSSECLWSNNKFKDKKSGLDIHCKKEFPALP